MGIPVDIDKLIRQRVVESSRIEYKADYNPDVVVRTICAFANDIDNIGGGYIVLGIEDENGRPKLPPKGLAPSEVDSILRRLNEHCRYIEPLYRPVAEPVVYDGKQLIVLWISGGFSRPYRAPKSVSQQQSYKYFYIRKFSSSVIASPEEEAELFYISSSIPFDDRPCLPASPSDLDVELMRRHLKETGSALYEESLSMRAMEIAETLQLLDGPPESVRPRNVGILMFCQQPEKYFRYARIEVVDIPDPTGTGMVEKIFTGPIQTQLRDALAYIRNYVLKEAVIKQDDRAEADRFFNYPYRAVEEILSNAVYHRSYQIHEPIEVRITPNGMEITSFPGFDRSITDQDIADFEIRTRACRNRRIGDFLKDLQMIEGRNTGFPNAKRALEQNGSDPLSFQMDPERTYLTVEIPVHPYFAKKEKKPVKYQIYEDKVRYVLQETPLTLTEIAHAMGYKGISAKLKKTVSSMVEERSLEKSLDDDNSVRYKVNDD